MLGGGTSTALHVISIETLMFVLNTIQKVVDASMTQRFLELQLELWEDGVFMIVSVDTSRRRVVRRRSMDVELRYADVSEMYRTLERHSVSIEAHELR